MLVRLEKNKAGWTVTSLSGKTHQKIIAVAEGVRLSNARFQKYSVTGYLDAMFGAEVEDFATDDIDVARAMGINGRFQPCHHAAIHDGKNTGWFDSCTKESVIDVRYITTMGDRVFYSTQIDIDADRAEHEPEGIPINAGVPDSLAAPTTVWTARGHFRAFLTEAKKEIMGR